MNKAVLLISFGLLAGMVSAAEIEPTWESMAANYKIPEWFQDGKIGVWMHWGISSAVDENRPNDGSWYGRNMYGGGKGVAKTLSEWHTERYGPPSEFGYEKLIPLFKAEKWDPDALVKFVRDNGARFIMPVACHHDNFDMYDSSHPWNSVDMGPHRDTLKEWKEAATKYGLKFGVSTHLYWSPGWFSPARKYQKPGTLEWKLFNMDYSASDYGSQDSWNEHWYARCWELIEKYDPDMFNNDAPYPNEEGGKSLGVKLFSSYINRDLKENNGKQTVIFSCKNDKLDRAAFTYNLERGSSDKIQPEPWMWATDLSGNWFYRKGSVNKMSIPVMVGNAIDAISKNGVVMLNIALRGDGTLPENQAAYLTAFGDFLKINGEGIYGTRPWKTFGEGPLKMKDGRQGENHKDFTQEDIRFTTKDGVLYAFVLALPTEDIVIKTLATGGVYDGDIGVITLLGSDEKLTWNRASDALTIQRPKTLPGPLVMGFRISGLNAATTKEMRQQNRAARGEVRSKSKAEIDWDGQRFRNVPYKQDDERELMAAESICNAASTNADFYLSTKGSDAWSGTLSGPNAQGTDGPFATLERARNAVRDFRKSKSADIVVLVHEGTYQLDKTVVFDLEDSGIGDSTVTYAAYPGETPVFSSGREIKGWKKVSGKLPGLPKAAWGNIWEANVSERFFTLYDAEGMLPRARSVGFIPLEGGSRNRLHFPEGRLKNWPNVEDVEIVVRPHHAWIVNILPLVSVDEKEQMAQTSIDATYAMDELHFLKGTESCWVENVLEELDEPGEWVLNTKEGKVYLWPRGTTPVKFPVLIEYIRVEGKIDKMGPKDIPVRNLCFRGLTFMHGDRYQVAQDDAGLQHDWDFLDKANAMVRLRGTENCTIEQCHFAHSGSGAIRVDMHGQENTISGNHIEYMGGAGILLCGYGPGTKDVNKNNLVYNNHIHHTGRIYSHSPGIMVWQSGENRVANNLVDHTPYTGIILSGCMTDFFTKNGRELGRTIRRHEIGDLPKNPELEDVRPYLHSHDNLIEYNEIHNVMEKMGDGNGIYIRGAGAGNVIRRNYIHHLVTPMLMQAAIRTDGGQRDTLIAENLIYKCMAQGIILKLNNRAENNIVADVLAPPRGYYMSLREGPLTDAVIKRNIFYSVNKETVFIDELAPGNGRNIEDSRGRALARAKDADTDYNIYYCAADPMLGKTMLEKQQGDGIDTHSLAVDPLFVDPANGDFRLKPNSPALKLGFVPIDLSRVGLRPTKE